MSGRTAKQLELRFRTLGSPRPDDASCGTQLVHLRADERAQARRAHPVGSRWVLVGTVVRRLRVAARGRIRRRHADSRREDVARRRGLAEARSRRARRATACARLALLDASRRTQPLAVDFAAVVLPDVRDEIDYPRG